MRLVDADKLLSLPLLNGDYDKENANEDFMNGIFTATEMIENAPTAYDMDKVIEYLKSTEICVQCMNKHNSVAICATFCDIGKKLEIVKAGGVNE